MAVVVAKKKKGAVRNRKILANGPSFNMVNIGGRWVVYENAAVPPNVPMYRALCEICHNASAYLMLRVPPTVECLSCKEDRIALDALRFQEESGINLGWKSPALNERRDYLTEVDIGGMSLKRKR